MASNLRARTRAFAVADNNIATFHLLLTLALWIGALWIGTAGFGNPVFMAVSVVIFVAASVRLFGVQHDNGHYAYFTTRKANVISGVILGAFTANPFHTMRYNHNRHHAHIGNLDEMDSHEVTTWTVAQWRAASPMARLGYRLYRSPLSIGLIGPLFIFFIRYRVPKNARKVGLWDCAMQNALMVTLWLSVFAIGGWRASVVQALGSFSAAIVGTLMVYAGHNHEETYWRDAANVDFEDAALKGASVLELGPVFDFMSFNFAYHDLHHLNSRVPCYRLRACHNALRDELEPTRLGLWEALGSLRWKLWDEDRQRMVRFADVRAEAGEMRHV
ncbi:fatty acid desaturase [Pelagovum pacificum]|uniref:Fatty acid desaturase n=1 Tax=Pelagovum pacificum TaxID=2588711 RepID=A0A5C5GHV2_9RHOB|nr:fatty acid desaturase [Pelagovum pacificum]QQA43401.1 fatty acid desaturase [Pelagovum pacificum]TNY33461.1 fatty acid desaturase [Pelagovum pacificum]